MRGGTGKILALDSGAGHLVVDLINHQYHAQEEYPTRLDAITAYVHHEVHRLRKSCASDPSSGNCSIAAIALLASRGKRQRHSNQLRPRLAREPRQLSQDLVPAVRSTL